MWKRRDINTQSSFFGYLVMPMIQEQVVLPLVVVKRRNLFMHKIKVTLQVQKALNVYPKVYAYLVCKETVPKLTVVETGTRVS